MTGWIISRGTDGREHARGSSGAARKTLASLFLEREEGCAEGERKGAPHATIGLAGRRLLPWVVLLLTVLFAGAAQAFWFGIPTGYYTPQSYYKYGAVYARTIVPGPNNKPVYVVYNDLGEEIAIIGETHEEPLASARVLAGDYYRALLTQLRQVREQYELTDQDLVNRGTFNGATYTTVDGKLITKPPLRDDTLWVAVRPADQRYTTDSAQLVLLELPIDPTQELAEDTQSLLLDKNGEILYQTPENIGFRVGFYGSETGQVNQGSRSYDDTLYGPLRGVYLSLGMAYTGAAITDEQGKYAMTYMLPPCPGFTFEYTTNVYLELYYKRFNPRGSPNFPYYLMRPGYDFCNGLGVYNLAAAAIVATSATPVTRPTDFPIDIMVLAGRAYVADTAGNPISIGDATRYDGSRKALERAKQDQYDLDGDGQPDKTELGHIVTPADGSAPYFEKQDQAPEVQGVWLSSVHDVGAIGTDLSDGQSTTLPDLTRLPDWSADFDDRALLSSLSAADLRDTDLYIFRESDGALLIERRGLDERETSFIGADAERQRFFYSLRLLGRSALNAFGYARTAAEYEQFQQAEGLLDPAYYQRAADHLRAGEYVRIIAINRPSGYMGSLSVPLQAAGAGADPTEISFPIDELVMRPPNLKIWAERKSEVEAGLTQGETREQAIGNEGAGLADDVLISLYTEWLDADGRPLPEALGEYGYTGRLAKVLEPNQLAPVEGSFSECDPACDEDGNQLSQFAIRPGRQLQVVRLPEAVLGKEHLYVHVSGTPASRTPDFGSGGQAGSVLEFRPAKFVPVQVPVYDEAATHLALQVYNGLRADDPNPDLTRPAPFYRFVYRPEFQFSLYDLTVQEIRRTDVEGQTTDVLPLAQPVLTSSDQLVELYYDLLGPAVGGEPLSPLTPYSYEGERELVFALGEQEVRATVSADGTLRFDNLDHLGLLNPDDYLTIRLYSNNDAGNVLWEWAFGLLSIFPPVQDDEVVIEVPADDADDYTVWASYFSSPADTEHKWLYWNASGTAVLTPVSQGNPEGYYITSVDFPNTAGTETKISACMFSPTSPLIAGATFKTVPGAPHTATLTLSGQTAIGGLGGIMVSADIFDAVGNRVKDGTPVFIEVPELAVEGNRETVGGKAEFKLIGAQAPGTHEAILHVGNVAKPFTVTVHNVSLAISMPEEIEVGKTADATITASSSYGDLTGLQIHLGFIRGRADVSDVVLTGNSVTLSVYGGDIRGDGTLFAAVADKYIRKDYRVIEPSEVSLLDTLLISDAAAPGSVTIGDATYEYTNQTHVVLRGQPGKRLDLSLVDYLDPPMLPLLKYSMQSQPTDTVPDEMLGVPASTSDISRIFSDNNAFTYAYQFSDASTMTVAYSGLSSVSRLGAVFDLYIPAGSEPAGTLLSYADLGLSLSFDGSHRLVWAQSKEGAATSSAISQVLTSGRWYRIAAHVIDSGLVLQVDKQIAKAGLLAITNSGNKSPLIIGTSFIGKMANLAIFDWDTAKLVRFADGNLNQQAVIPESGVATVPFSTSPLAYAQLEQRRIAYQSEGFSLIRPAYAEGSICNAPSAGSLDFFEQPMDASEALFRTIADCEYLPKIKKAWITVQDESGNISRRAYALAELSAYVTLYTQIKAAELAIKYGPSCANGILTGKVTDLASATCDFITSLLVVGDLRDFVLHSYWAWTDEVDEATGERKFDEATYVFATLGIATTLVEVTGIGVTVDAAVAGCKTASKLMKGAPVLLSLASYLKKQVLPHWKDLGQARAAIDKVLPVMQVIALVHYYGQDMADVVYLLGQVTRDQFEGWVNYAAKAILVSDPVIVANTGTTLDFFVRTAVAADRDQILRWLDNTGKLDGFARALQATLNRAGLVAGELKLNKSHRAKAINSAIDIIGRNYDKMPIEDLKNAIAKSEVLTAFAVVYDIEKKLNRSGLMDTLTRFPCTANAVCRLGGVAQAGFTGPEAIAKFFDMITEIAISGKMVDGAQFSKTLEQLGKIQKNGEVNFNLAKGTAEVIGLAARVSRLEGAKIRNFEELLAIVGQGKRFHDLVIEINGVVHRIEAKAWAPNEALGRLIGSLGGKVDVDDAYDKGGQLFKDLVEAINKKKNKDPEKIKWMFDDRVTTEHLFGANGDGGFVGELIEQLEGNATMREALLKAVGQGGLLKNPRLVEDYMDDIVIPTLRELFVAPF